MNRVKTTTTTTGTGNITVSATAAARCLPLSSIATGKQVAMMIEDEAGTDWELSLCTILTTTTFSRDTVLNGSAGAGTKVNFAAGTKTVFATMDANAIALVSDIPFSATIPLTRAGSSYMAASTVTGPLTFTAAAGAVRGALAYLRLTADGVNTPNFTAFKEWGGSSGYDNRNGIVNQVQFFYDGADLFYSASQAVGAAPAATAVTMSGPTGGVVNAASTNFTVGTNAARTAAVIVTPAPVAGVTFNPSSVTLPIGSATATFTATPTTTGAKTIAVTNNASLSNPASITYTVTAAATAPATMVAPVATQTGATTASVALTAPSDGGQAITGYTVTSNPAGGVDSNAGTTALTHNMTGLTTGQAYTFTATATNPVGTSSASPASNSVTPAAAASNYPRLTGLVSLTESGADPYTYTGTGDTFSNTIGGVSVKSLPANTDGSWDFKVTAANSILAGFNLNQPLTLWGNWKYGVFANAGTGATPGDYRRISVGANAINAAGLTPAAGDILRLARVGNVLKIQLARAATPTTFVDMETTNYGSAPQMWIQLLCSNTAAVQLLAQTGFA